MKRQTAFARWLEGELEKRGWSQAELARRTGIPTGTIGNWLNTPIERPKKREWLIALAEAFGLPYEEVEARVGQHEEGRLDEERLLEDPRVRRIVSLLADLPPLTRDSLLDAWLQVVHISLGQHPRPDAPESASLDAPGRAHRAPA